MEHIGEGFFFLMQELYRVCEDGAVLDIRVPHPFHQGFYEDLTHVRPILPLAMQKLGRKYCSESVATGCYDRGLADRLGVDFEMIEHKFIPDSYYHEALYKGPSDELKRTFREALNTCIEIQMRLRVVKEAT